MMKGVLLLTMTVTLIGCSNNELSQVKDDYWFLLDENKENIPYVVDSVKHLSKSTQEALLKETLDKVSDNDKVFITSYLKALK